MDLSVALVQAYLRVNGYFTVAEFPVVESHGRRGSPESLRTATDVDILAFRFSRAGQLLPATGRATMRDRRLSALDPELRTPQDAGDMIIGEVKEGRAELNAHAADPAVLRAVLVRFGCCDSARAGETADALARRGHAVLANGHGVRLLAFGSMIPAQGSHSTPFHVVSLVHIRNFLRAYVRANWRVLKAGGTKDAALGWIYLQEKLDRAAEKQRRGT